MSDQTYSPHGAIVIIDDCPVASKSAELIIKRQYPDAHIISFGSGDEAIEAFTDEVLKDDAVSLVITDQAMSGLNGPDLVCALHSIFPSKPVIIRSGLEDESSSAAYLHLLQVNFGDLRDAPLFCISKPHGAEALQELVDKALEPEKDPICPYAKCTAMFKAAKAMVALNGGQITGDELDGFFDELDRVDAKLGISPRSPTVL